MNTGIVTAVAITSLLNLFFTYGVIRRLKEHEERFAGLDPVGPLRTANPAIGSEIPEFSATAVDGRSVDTTMLRSCDAYVGFFDTDCPPCREQLPEFARLSQGRHSRQFVAFIAGDREQASEMSASFGDRAFVVIEEGPAETAAALGVDGFPTLLTLDHGVVAANALDTAGLVRLSPVR